MTITIHVCKNSYFGLNFFLQKFHLKYFFFPFHGVSRKNRPCEIGHSDIDFIKWLTLLYCDRTWVGCLACTVWLHLVRTPILAPPSPENETRVKQSHAYSLCISDLSRQKLILLNVSLLENVPTCIIITDTHNISHNWQEKIKRIML